jgi:GPN-loop GTPase
MSQLVTPIPLSPTAMAEPSARKPVCIIAIGMAGSGKSTFVQRLNAHLHALSPPAPPYVVNLDPAVTNISYEPNIDIRDTVDYHQVMRQCAIAVSLCTLR